MKMRIEPRRLSGAVAAAPSKSMGHRLCIGATLAGNSVVRRFGHSVDMDATTGALASLGWHVGQRQPDGSFHTPECHRDSCADRVVDCCESGSTLRILLPLALLDGQPTTFTGAPRLLQRSMELYAQLCRERGIEWAQSESGIRVCGTLTAGRFSMRGDISSQFISGLLFALPTLDGDSIIELIGTVESKPYIDLTLQALSVFGIEANWDGAARLRVPGRQCWQPAQCQVDGDYSHAAFFLVAGAMGVAPGVAVQGLDEKSLQGDRAIVNVLRQMGAQIDASDDGFCAVPSALHGTQIDAAQIPDLVPILSVAACAAEGDTRIVNAGRLRDKESDRLAAMARELTALGAAVQEEPEGLRIQGGQRLTGSCVGAHNDHRIAMSLAMASALCDGTVLLDGAESVRKSAPQFWDEFRSLGGCCQEATENGDDENEDR